MIDLVNRSNRNVIGVSREYREGYEAIDWGKSFSFFRVLKGKVKCRECGRVMRKEKGYWWCFWDGSIRRSLWQRMKSAYSRLMN